MKKCFAWLFLLISSVVYSQYGYRDSNMIGVTLGVNQFQLHTSDLQITPANGWNVGLSMRGNFYNDWDGIYGIQFSEYNCKVATLNALGHTEDVNLKLPCANITFQFSYKFIENHLSVEFGPMVQINGKFTVDKAFENNTIKGNTTYTVDDITKIGNVGVYPVVGLSAGLRNVRLNATYQYGLVNMLGKIDGSMKGNASIVSGNVIFYF